MLWIAERQGIVIQICGRLCRLESVHGYMILSVKESMLWYHAYLVLTASSGLRNVEHLRN